MAYLGNVPAQSFISFERQVFTIVNSQTAYTLSHSVTNENDIRLVVNNVVQEPGSGKAYTASGTTLTLSAALVNGTDEMYCVFLGRAVGTVNAPAGSVGTSQLIDLNVTTGKIAADAVNGDKIADDSISDEHLDPTVITGQTAETSVATDDLILLSDTSASGALKKMTRANFVSGVGGNMTPAFHAYLGSSLSNLSDGSTTIIAAANEVYDTDNAYDTSTYRFTPQVAGKYFVYVQAVGDSQGTANLVDTDLYIYKNSTMSGRGNLNCSNNNLRLATLYTSAVLDMNGSSDYVYASMYLNTGDSGSYLITGNATWQGTYFGAYRIIE
jgi:hypothetical protein